MKAMRAVPFVQLAVCALLAAGFANDARAQAGGPAQTLLDGTFVGNLGGFIVGTDIKASLNGESTNNSEIDFDKTFGDAGEHTRIRGDLLWRITPNHHLRFLYFNNTVTPQARHRRRPRLGRRRLPRGRRGQVEDQPQDRRARLRVRLHPPADVRAERQPRRALDGHSASALAATPRSPIRTATAASLGPPRRVGLGAAAGDRPARRLGGRAAGLPRRPGAVLQGQGRRHRRQLTDLRAGVTWMFSQNFGVGRRLQPVHRQRQGRARTTSTAA